MRLLFKLYKEEPEHLRAIGEQFKQYIKEKGTSMLQSVEL